MRACSRRSRTGPRPRKVASSLSKACASGSSDKRARSRSASAISDTASSCASVSASAREINPESSVSAFPRRAPRLPSSVNNSFRSPINSRISECSCIRRASSSAKRCRSSSARRRLESVSASIWSKRACAARIFSSEALLLL